MQHCLNKRRSNTNAPKDYVEEIFEKELQTGYPGEQKKPKDYAHEGRRPPVDWAYLEDPDTNPDLI